MKKLTILLLVCFLMPMLTKGQTELIAKVDAMIAEYLMMDLFSGTVLIAENGNTIYEKSFGFSDRMKSIKNDTKTKYDLGSLNKLFTSTAILKLSEMNKLKLDDRLGKYLTGFSDDILNKVTIRHLLKHESGFGDFLNHPEFNKNWGDFKSVNDFLRIIKEEKLLFEPGTNNRYSNSGSAVLGAVIESVTGISYFEAIENLILIPLNLQETYFRNTDNISSKALRYTRDFEGNINISQFQAWPSPAGSGYSCPGDALKFIQSIIYSDKLLNDGSKLLLLTRFGEESPKTLEAIMADSKEMRGWAGGAPGVNTMIRQSLMNNFTVIIFSNYSPPAAMDLASGISSIFEIGSYNQPKLPLSEKIYKNFTQKGSEYIVNNFEQLISGYRLRGPRHFILNELGYGLFQAGKTDEAILILKTNVNLYPDEANTYDSLAEAYMLTGNKSMAMEYYTKTLETDPNFPGAAGKLEKLKLSKE